MISEIAEYAGCDARVVWYAIHNEDHDNLEEDQAYLDGKMGEVVDIAALDVSEIMARMEEMEAEEVDEKLDGMIMLDSDDNPFDAELETENNPATVAVLSYRNEYIKEDGL
ncbi:hypothetical protein EW026_g2456 [Hermanssonia centrifuga]|uniref:Uncharacterized protein n=1 Tax=Hermanssonia centrifuga TaxID=98765 RepID=A0A4S4KNV6_9APHY|nr:hypothetical protein EW026_g2456 [Hermanssonia centrifuga]